MNDYYKKPAFIATAIIAISFFISYVNVGDKDTVKFSAGRIINIGVEFTIVPSPDANYAESLMDTILFMEKTEKHLIVKLH